MRVGHRQLSILKYPNQFSGWGIFLSVIPVSNDVTHVENAIDRIYKNFIDIEHINSDYS